MSDAVVWFILFPLAVLALAGIFFPFKDLDADKWTLPGRLGWLSIAISIGYLISVLILASRLGN